MSTFDPYAVQDEIEELETKINKLTEALLDLKYRTQENGWHCWDGEYPDFEICKHDERIHEECTNANLALGWKEE